MLSQRSLGGIILIVGIIVIVALIMREPLFLSDKFRRINSNELTDSESESDSETEKYTTRRRERYTTRRKVIKVDPPTGMNIVSTGKMPNPQMLPIKAEKRSEPINPVTAPVGTTLVSKISSLDPPKINYDQRKEDFPTTYPIADYPQAPASPYIDQVYEPNTGDLLGTWRGYQDYLIPPFLSRFRRFGPFMTKYQYPYVPSVWPQIAPSAYQGYCQQQLDLGTGIMTLQVADVLNLYRDEWTISAWIKFNPKYIHEPFTFLHMGMTKAAPYRAVVGGPRMTYHPDGYLTLEIVDTYGLVQKTTVDLKNVDVTSWNFYAWTQSAVVQRFYINANMVIDKGLVAPPYVKPSGTFFLESLGVAVFKNFKICGVAQEPQAINVEALNGPYYK